MARPLRIDIADGWYHVTARGIERRTIFGEQREYEHFQGLLAEAVDRHRLLLHAFVQLENHYHLVVQTPDANLSAAMQWINVSYAVWYNRRHGRVGPLFQGRFKSMPVENSSWAYELSLYVHLNPVMRKAHGLDKGGKKAEAQGWVVPDSATVTRRLGELRRYRWSSYRAYGGYGKGPEWLTRGELLRRAARRKDERTGRYRADVKDRLSKGVDPLLREQLADGFALGAEGFRDRLRRLGRDERELAGRGKLRRRKSFDELAALVESLSGEAQAAFMVRRGGWARPAAPPGPPPELGLYAREVATRLWGIPRASSS